MRVGMVFALLAACGLGVCIGTYIGQSHDHYADGESSTVGMFNQNIFALAQQNSFFRKVLVTGNHSQVVIMNIPVGGEIGMERHNVDQTLVFVQGNGQAIIDGKASDVYTQSLIFVPAGVEHNVKNIGTDELKLFTVYAPAQHKSGTIEENKK